MYKSRIHQHDKAEAMFKYASGGDKKYVRNEEIEEST